MVKMLFVFMIYLVDNFPMLNLYLTFTNEFGIKIEAVNEAHNQ